MSRFIRLLADYDKASALQATALHGFPTEKWDD